MELLMQLVSRQSRANEAADLWKRQYSSRNGSMSSDRLATYERLKELGSTPDPDAVDRVIGNQSWTRLNCCECSAEVTRVVEFSVNDDEYSHRVCVECLQKAVVLIESK